MKKLDTLDTDVLERYNEKQTRQRLILTTAFLVIAVLASLLFTDKSGDDLLAWTDGTFLVSLPDGSTYSTPFEDIQRLTLVEAPDFGTCVSGEEEKTLRYGIWENEALGSYVLCAYRCFDPIIQVETEDHIFWISYESPDTTRLLYENFAQEVANAKAVPAA